MKVLVTGLNGTLAPVLAALLRHQGHEVLAWDRAAQPTDDEDAGRAWLDRVRPDAIAHLATGSVHWAGWMAWWAAQGDRPFIFASTAMVFDGGGPHRPADERDARDDYGRGKARSEDAVRQAHPFASIARLGWQIDLARGGNTMLATLERWQQEQGVIEASRRWRPACSFIDDTVSVLAQLLLEPLPGVLHLDSNADEGWRFDQIARALAQAADRPHWVVRGVEGYRHDQRLLGGPLDLPPLSQRLPALSMPRPARRPG